MNRRMAVNSAIAGVLAIGVVTAASAGGWLSATAAAGAVPVSSQHNPSGHWVNSWTSMPQLTEPRNLPPAPFTQFLNTTLRQTIRVTIAGERLRLRFSNVFGDKPLPISAVSVALPAG